jgi:hypothetical protein
MPGASIEFDAMKNLGNPFPLTPALSPGERENHRQSVGESRVAETFRRRALPLPLLGGEGWGEGERTVEIASALTCTPLSSLIFHLSFGGASASSRLANRSAIIRQWMRRALLQRIPYRVADSLSLASQARVPEPQYLDAPRLQPGITIHIFGLLSRESVLKTIQLDVQLRFQTKEIEDVRPERMLAAKLIVGKPAVPQPAPQELLGPRVVFPHHPRNAKQFGRCHAERIGIASLTAQARSLDPHPAPRLLRGEAAMSLVAPAGERELRWQMTGGLNTGVSKGGPFPLTPALSPGERENHPQAAGESNALEISNAPASLHPLPRGEGWGEGERIVPPLRTSNRSQNFRTAFTPI